MSTDSTQTPRKIVLFGPPNSGKTSILLSIFGGVEPELILNTPIEPTMGIDTAIYRWGHVDIGVFDLSGQEMEIFLGQEKNFVFPDTDELLVVFEYGCSPEKVIKLIKLMANVVKSFEIPEIHIIVHKIDKASGEEAATQYLNQIQDMLNKVFGINQLKVFGTSLYPPFYSKFKFQMNWILSGLEITLEDMKKLQAVPVSESLLRSLRTSGFIKVNLDDESLTEVPKPNPYGYNEMTTIKNDREIKEFDREKET